MANEIHSAHDRLPFSEMTLEECTELLNRRGNNLDQYTICQIEEMAPKPDSSFLLPTLIITTKEGIHLNTGITLEQYCKWKNK